MMLKPFMEKKFISEVPSGFPPGRLAAGLLQFAQNSRLSAQQRFLTSLMSVQHPEANVGLFQICKGLIQTWAALEDLSRPDAEIIEAARKVCDTMEWQPMDQ